MKILIVGDVVGKPGRTILNEFLERKSDEYDFIIVNGENAAGGFGLTEKIADGFFDIGVDMITTGNHVWDKKEMYEYLQKTDKVIRPLNYPKGVPGIGYTVLSAKNGEKVAVVNLLGRVFMPQVDCPFQRFDEILEDIRKETKNVIVDFHAEASSEKMAMGWYLDGKVSLVFGTHTHIQTSDNRILHKSTGYITDIGMTGAHDGIIGMKVESVLPKFLTGLPSRFEVCEDNIRLNGLEIELENDGSCKSVERIDVSMEELDFM